MSSLYEINNAIANFEPEIDEETGELLNSDLLDRLNMAREDKIESICLYVKNLNAEAAAIKAERDNLDERMKSKERKADSLKRYLAQALAGEKFESPKVKVSYRKSQQIVLAGEFDEWAQENAPELLTVKTTYTPSKTAIKEALLDGKTVKYATLIENKNIQIK